MQSIMMKRMFSMLAVMLVLIGGLGFVKFRQIQRPWLRARPFSCRLKPSRRSWRSRTEWPETLSAIGTVAAVQGVTVSADLPAPSIASHSSRASRSRRARCSCELDTRQERAQLAAVEAQRDLARLNFDRMQGLLKESVISRAEYDRATADRRADGSASRRDSRRDRAKERSARRSRASSASVR